MEFRQLGQSSLRLAPLVLGGNVFGWNVDAKTSFAILDAFVDAGFNAIDTADSYSRWAPGHVGGESETIIGKWLKASGKRDKVVIATKFGEDMGEGRSTRKGYMQRAAAASLRRLQTDHIDLYQTHFDDEVTPVEETMAGFAQLIAEGNVRAAGASNITPERFAESLTPVSGSACRATRACSRFTICPTAANSKPAMKRSADGRPSASSPTTALPPVSSPANTTPPPMPMATRARPAPEKIPERARQPHSRRHRQGGGQARDDLRPGGAGLADRPHHGADRVRHQPRPARRYPQGAAAQALGGGYGDTERGRRLIQEAEQPSAFSLSYHGAHSTRLVSR